MNKGKNRISEFFAGKGFYVVLFVCLAAVGISGYVLFFGLGNGNKAENDPDSSLNWVAPEVTSNPARVVTPAPQATTPSAITAAPSSAAPSMAPTERPADAPEVLGVAENMTAPVVPPKTEPAPSTPKPEATPKPAETKKPSSPGTFYWPVSGSIVEPFSIDELIKSSTMGDWRTHAGIDIETIDGASVCAVADGTVLSIEDDPAWGVTVVVEHNGGLTSSYSNLLPGVVVTVGQKLNAGDIIGAVGASASSEIAQDSHLHFEMQKDGAAIDPATLLPQKLN